MGVDEARHRDQALRVHLLQAVRRAADAAVAHDQVARLVDAGRGVEHARAAQHQGGGRAGPLDEPGRHHSASAPIGSAGSTAAAGSASRW